MRNPRFLLDQARDAVAWCREASAAPIILGGAGFSILPQAILEYLGAEMAFKAKARRFFPSCLDRLQSGQTRIRCPTLSQRQSRAGKAFFRQRSERAAIARSGSSGSISFRS